MANLYIEGKVFEEMHMPRSEWSDNPEIHMLENESGKLGRVDIHNGFCCESNIIDSQGKKRSP